MGDDRRIEALLEITEALCGKTGYSEVVAGALEASLRTVDAEAGSVLLYSPDDGALVFEYVLGPVADRLLDRRLPRGQGLAGKVFETGVPLLSNDVPKEEGHLLRVPQQTGYPAFTMITVPLRTLGGRRLGILQALNKRQGRFGSDDLELLTIVATQVATTIENARLHEEARLGTVARLLANIGHDVKNMIAPVIASAAALEAILQKHFAVLEQAAARPEHEQLGAAEIARQAEESRQRCREAMEILHRAAVRVRERTLQMADCVRGKVSPPCLKPTEVPSIAREVVSVLGPWATEAGIHLELGQDGTWPLILADGSHLFNAVYNLAVNALQQTPRGGRVTIRLHGVPAGQPPDGQRVEIEVADTGEGIPPEVLRRLFTGDLVTTKPHGIGLGTRIVSEVAEMHGGTVSASSRPGEGSCFTLALPVGREEHPQPAQAALEATWAGGA
jgi:signal transduction histidine kinase